MKSTNIFFRLFKMQRENQHNGHTHTQRQKQNECFKYPNYFLGFYGQKWNQNVSFCSRCMETLAKVKLAFVGTAGTFIQSLTHQCEDLTDPSGTTWGQEWCNPVSGGRPSQPAGQRHTPPNNDPFNASSSFPTTGFTFIDSFDNKILHKI